MRQDEMIRAALDGAMRDEPPCAAGLDEVLVRARRFQVRRRVGAGVAAVSVAGLALTVALAAARGGGAGGSGDDLAAPPSAGPALASTAPARTAGGSGAAPVTAPGQMLATLKRLVPPGFSVSQPFAEEGYAVVVLTDAAGKGQVSVNVRPAFGEPSFFTCAGRPELAAAGSTCHDERLPDGTRIVTSQGSAEPNGVADALTAMVDVLTPDGVRVAVSEYNRVPGAPASPTRAEPPLTADQLRAIATDPAWLG